MDDYESPVVRRLRSDTLRTITRKPKFVPGLYAVVDVHTERVINETLAPFDAPTLEMAIEEVYNTYPGPPLERRGWKVVPMTEAQQEQYEQLVAM